MSSVTRKKHIVARQAQAQDNTVTNFLLDICFNILFNVYLKFKTERTIITFPQTKH